MRLPAIVFSCAVLVAGCGGRHASDGDAPPDLPPARVRIASVRSMELAEQVDCVGTVLPLRTAQLSTKVMGTIALMPVSLGERVHTGELVAKISADEISARVEQARAQLNSAKRDLERERDLLAKGASTADMVKGLGDRYDAAQAMLREAEDMAGYTEIRAPFDGIVSRKFADAGDLASPGTPLLEVDAADQFQVEAMLADAVAGGLKVGEALTVSVPGRGVTFAGRLAELSSAADPAAHTVVAKITVPAGVAVRSGEFARVQARGTEASSLMIPASAVSTNGQMQRVFVVGEGNRAVLRLVKTGAVRGDLVEVLSGLDEGERVVVAPPPGLAEGRPLEVEP